MVVSILRLGGIAGISIIAAHAALDPAGVSRRDLLGYESFQGIMGTSRYSRIPVIHVQTEDFGGDGVYSSLILSEHRIIQPWVESL